MDGLFLGAAKIFILLFALIDPFGNVPLFLGMTRSNDDAERNRMAGRACLAALFVLTLFALFGRSILNIFSIDVPAFQVAGGIVLAVTALPMLSATRPGARLLACEEEEGEEKDDVSIVPLAIPLLAGPGSITAVIALTQQSPPAAPSIVVIAIVAVVLALSYLILRFASRIARLIGRTGVNILTRLSGLIILVVAVQFVLEGAKTFFGLK